MLYTLTCSTIAMLFLLLKHEVIFISTTIETFYLLKSLTVDPVPKQEIQNKFVHQPKLQ
uniref:Uncharacterized protein n=1 Tax=Arundo donax TaxID=35708 RepID=A0A0A9H3Y8_ARUDO